VTITFHAAACKAGRLDWGQLTCYPVQCEVRRGLSDSVAPSPCIIQQVRCQLSRSADGDAVAETFFWTDSSFLLTLNVSGRKEHYVKSFIIGRPHHH